MKKIILFVLIVFTVHTQAQILFDNSQIRTFNFTFYNSNWTTALHTNIAYNIDTMIPAKLVVDNITYDSVGVQYYNNSAYSATKAKNPIKIKMNEFIKGQNLYGIKEFKLSNMYKDPSCVREVLMYEVYRKYLPASQASYVKFMANGISYGLYVAIETITDDFLNDHYNTDLNTLVDCGEPNIQPVTPVGCTAAFGILPSSLLYLGTDSLCYKQSYEMKSTNGWGQLSQVINTLNNNKTQIASTFNIDRVLWMLALNNIFVNLDSYTGSGDNYYLYNDDYNHMNVIPKNLNRSLGVYLKGGVAGAADLGLAELFNLPPAWNSTNTNHPLIKNILTDANLYKRYLAHYRTIYNTYIATDALYNRALELNALIDLEAQFDVNLLYGYANFSNATNQTVVSGKNTYIGIKTLLDGRKTFLSALSEMKLSEPSITMVTEFTDVVTAEEPVWITANITNATTVYLNYKNRKQAPYTEIQMFDDGLHHDNNAADGIYGVSIPSQIPNTKVYYYIYAQNNDAGKFSPVTAAYDYYSYRIEPYNHPAGDIVINEFMASNAATLQNPQGLYNDWIELYNNTSADISLTNYHLSDKLTNTTLWTMPDTIIKANNYILIWMDADTLATTGLHANFKLSKNDGFIVLTDNNNLVLDSLSYIKQNVDTSYGRYPNGTGNFTFMPASPTTANLFFNSITTIEKSLISPIEVWPNPAKNSIAIKVINKHANNQISIYNSILQKIQDYTFDKNTNFFNCNISELAPGLYFIKHGESTAKFIKN